MRYVCFHLAKAGVPYYQISVTARSAADFSPYAGSLNAKAAAFLWSANGIEPQEALYKMVPPSQILVDADGRIVRRWPGTDQRKDARYNMSSQIVADTLEELKLRQGFQRQSVELILSVCSRYLLDGASGSCPSPVSCSQSAH